MSMLFGTTILWAACGVAVAPSARASGSILRGLDRLFLLKTGDVIHPC
jgi:hypothetical protein